MLDDSQVKLAEVAWTGILRQATRGTSGFVNVRYGGSSSDDHDGGVDGPDTASGSHSSVLVVDRGSVAAATASAQTGFAALIFAAHRHNQRVSSDTLSTGANRESASQAIITDAPQGGCGPAEAWVCLDQHV